MHYWTDAQRSDGELSLLLSACIHFKFRLWYINITDQFIANRNNTTLLWTGNFGITAQFAPFAIPPINSALKQKTANYSATHWQHDNKATYKQIYKSYSQLTNTLSFGRHSNRKSRRYRNPLCLCLSFHLPLLSRSLSFAFPPCLSDMQPSMQTYAHSCLLFLCPSLSVCPVGSTPNRWRVRILG